MAEQNVLGSKSGADQRKPLKRKDPFRSSRLIFRAVRPSKDDDFLLRIQQSTISFQSFSCSLPTPKSIQTAEEYRKELQEDRMLAVIICLPSATENSVYISTPIGVLTMTCPDASRRHHRRALIGLFILDAYQGQGYGSEAIRWSLQWGFEMAGLHRIGIECVAWSEGLLRLYKKLGFKEEGTLRDFYWFEGQWWDYHQLGMLENEWRDIRDGTADWAPQA